ncbi:hypothetical protein EDC17_101139 [Sphingobacterium alimentarium]|uniref:Bacteriophage lambda head decoration protein D n=1 Tax=Sphingobacterium alimentarium TaxID=797292 RepID=A0A4R3VUE0_9SPHI|nr:hypothetical protein [Sphingobacterium alimentarium]TCV17122.1 hypothetical protein EDC17_101139 [Sphingobacterium alimentarium]
MGLKGVKRSGTQGFQKVVFENVVDTLPGGLILDVDKTDYPDGYVPEGSLVGRDAATGVGEVLSVTDGAIKPIGLTHRPSEVSDGGNTYANGVVISGTVRIKALPTALQAIVNDLRTALPRITFV